ALSVRATEASSTCGCPSNHCAWREASSCNAGLLLAESVRTCATEGSSAGPALACSSLGGDSTMTCTLVPTKPKELTPAIRGPPLQTQGSGLVEMARGAPTKSRAEFSFSRSRAENPPPPRTTSTAFTSQQIPAAPSKCPKFVLTEPSASTLSVGRPRPSTS